MGRLRQSIPQIHRRKAANGILFPGNGQSAVRTPDSEETSAPLILS